MGFRIITIDSLLESLGEDGLNAIGCEDVKCMHILELLDKAYE